ncbi:transporter substrate-binding domain-containing protein [Belnapia sp. F-4-1]|uniref:transporter substrate-binding domain-containing protein n=1 Tax=Belnapia sp. F-4-1 TaxID=1545443 RepID=UPI00191795FA|nr:transporter substrate-binding domain-containing protein [Belnapia sp. F-4-1]
MHKGVKQLPARWAAAVFVETSNVPVSRERIPVGLLYSGTGLYGAVGQEMLRGALLGLEEVNAWVSTDFVLEPLIADPSGRLRGYYEACDAMLRQHRAMHLVGCYTSAARRQVLPLVEAADALLWHPARYEGFESSESVIYVGAAPNQHVVPLARYMLQHIASSVYCIGSHYIWTWETARVLREMLGATGGHMAAERTLPLGETSVEHVVEEIVRLRPGVVFNTLVGQSSYAFFRAYHAARLRDPHASLPPILSCSLCEPELQIIGAEAGAGHIACSPWFQSLDTLENRVFLGRYRERFGPGSSPSVDAQASYTCMLLLGRAIKAAGSADVAAVRRALYRDSFRAPQGAICVDPDNNHTYATPRIARSNLAGQFDLLWESPALVRPDPYLVWLDQALSEHSEVSAPPRRHLRIVS